ncbi:MAG: transcriptional regulator PpsR [Rhizobiales bacterium]|nr:transcriptional regulator PpsR [Hyphomicrobiales bacterium]
MTQPTTTKNFRSAKRLLGVVDVDGAATAIAAASDLALILDAKGTIRDVAFQGEGFARDGCAGWVGRPWGETVTDESLPKIRALMDEANVRHATQWRQVTHPCPDGSQFPIQYSTLRIGSNGNIVALGRDLRTMAMMQQQLVEAQQSLARDYARLRQMESRYRLLFQIASEAVVVIDPQSLRVLEANPAATALLERPIDRLVGKRVVDWFDKEDARKLADVLSGVRHSGNPQTVTVTLASKPIDLNVSASLFRGDNTLHLLVRLTTASEFTAGQPDDKSALLDIVARLPDGFVITDAKGEIQSANSSFLDMAQIANEDRARGQNLEQFIGRSGVEFGVLMANLRDSGSVRHMPTVLRGALGMTEEVAISAVRVGDGAKSVYGFTVRATGPRPSTGPASASALPRSTDSMLELVGRVPMKDLVREATDMVERLCIEAALDLTDDNRASAAEVLGLSRQSLYAKLRRYGLGDLDEE